MWPFNGKAQSAANQANALVAPLPQQPRQSHLPAAAPSTPPVVMERPSPQAIDVRAENIKSIIAQGEYFEGNLRFQRGLKVDGHIKGNVEFGLTDGMLVVNDKAIVDGDILGPRAIIVGEVVGNLMVTGRLIVLPTARIKGDIAAGTLQIHEGASIDGRICTVSDMAERMREEGQGGSAPDGTNVPDGQADILRFVSGAAQSR